MIILLSLGSGRQLIQTRRTAAVQHAIDLASRVLETSHAGTIAILRRSDPSPPPARELSLPPTEAVRHLLRLTTNVQTEVGLAALLRDVLRDAGLPPEHRRQLIDRVAPLLASGSCNQTLPTLRPDWTRDGTGLWS